MAGKMMEKIAEREPMIDDALVAERFFYDGFRQTPRVHDGLEALHGRRTPEGKSGT
jgi:hypothetical protein